MEYKGNKFCDWCYKGFWKGEDSKIIKLGKKTYCSDSCKANHEYSLRRD